MDELRLTFLEQLASWKTILIALVVTMLFAVVIFPSRDRELKRDSGLQNPILDLRFSYTPDDAYTVMKSLESEGRRLYVETTASEDLVFPLTYVLCLAFTLTAVFQAAFSPTFRTISGKPGAHLTTAGIQAAASFRSITRLPFLVLACDYLENGCLIVLMLIYPTRLNWLARLASIFTSLKWILGAVCVLLIIFGVLIWGARKLGIKT